MKWLLAIVALLALPMVAANCTFEITAKNTDAFFDEVADLNSKLASCPVELKSPASTVLSNDLVLLRITMEDGSREHVLFTIKKDKLISIERKEIANPGHMLTTDECTLTAVLASSSKSGAFAYAFTQKRITLTSYGFLNFFKMLVVRPILNSAMKRMAVETDLSCDKRADGTICQHGGQCSSGNCVGEGQGPPWTYRCSCDPMVYKTNCQATPTTASASLPSTGREPGQLCDHGGQCRTGNCIGAGQGPPWIYKCSCDPMRLVESGC